MRIDQHECKTPRDLLDLVAYDIVPDYVKWQALALFIANMAELKGIDLDRELELESIGK